MSGITKSFYGNVVLNNVSLELRAGEVHALLGENGAGKSTLIKILGGAYTKDSGEIYLNGKLVPITNVESAKEHGIRIIHQELMLIPYMSIAENIFLGQEPKTAIGTVDTKLMIQKAQSFLDEMKLALSATQPLGSLNIAQQQMVEIIRAISFGAKIIVMDEPTSSLTDNEVEVLFDAIRTLKKNGVGIFYISHRMSELDVISDRITVMRDGEYITTVDTKKTSHDELIRLMVGRSINDMYQKSNHVREQITMEVKNLCSKKDVKNVSFTLYKGEVLGFYGLVGAGRTETMTTIFGLRKKDSGEIWIDGKLQHISNPRDAIKSGMGLVPEDRKKEGIFPIQSIRFNATLEVLSDFLSFGRYRAQKEMQYARQYVDDVMHTKYASIEERIANLSGGNQQKVIISRWLLATKSILILDEPTRGIDVKAKSDIYHLISELTEQGLSVIFVSSEMPELINICDRIVVMSNGQCAGTLLRDEFTQERIMSLSAKEF